MFKLNLEKAEEPEIQLPTFIGSEKKRIPEECGFLVHWLLKPLTVWITTICGKFLKSWECRLPYLRNLYANQDVRVRSVHGTTDSFQSGKGIHHYHPGYLTYMQSTSQEMAGCMKDKLESRLPGEISITSDMQMTPPWWRKVKRNWRASGWKWKRRVERWLKTQH